MSQPLRQHLTARDRRALLLGALIAAPLLAHAWALKPYLAALDDTRAAVERERALLQRELSLLARASQLPREMATLQQTATIANGRLFIGADAIESTSALSSYVGGALRGANVVVQQVESRDAGEASNGLQEIAIDVRAEGSLAGVLQALRTLESGARLVRITRVSVERSVAPLASGAPESLVLAATVRGYARLRVSD
jgi:hypothetical protein